MSIQVKQLPKTEAEQIKRFYLEFTGEELDDEETVTRVSFDEQGMYKRSYPPCVYANQDAQLCLVLGSKIIPITAEKIKQFNGSIDEVQLENYKEISLCLTVEDENENFITLPLQLKFDPDKNNGQLPDLMKIRSYLNKGKVDEIAKMLYVKTQGAPNYCSLSDLTPMVQYKVTGVERKDLGNRVTHILSVEKDGVQQKVWANFTINEYITAGALIGCDTTLEYFTQTRSNGKPKYFVKMENLLWKEDEESLKV